MAPTTLTSAFLHRLIGAAMLDRATYEEVEADPSATPQALAVVVAASVAAAIGAEGMHGGAATLAFFATTSVIALLAWATWALLTFEIGSRLLPTPDTRVDPGELLRTLGFAATPGWLQVIGLIHAAAVPVFIIAQVWMLAATVVAVRQALDYTSTARAIAVCVCGWALVIGLAAILGLAFGPAVS